MEGATNSGGYQISEGVFGAYSIIRAIRDPYTTISCSLAPYSYIDSRVSGATIFGVPTNGDWNIRTLIPSYDWDTNTLNYNYVDINDTTVSITEENQFVEVDRTLNNLFFYGDGASVTFNKSTSSVATIGTDFISFPTDNSSTIYVTTANKIDLTDYKTLRVHFQITHPAASANAWIRIGLYNGTGSVGITSGCYGTVSSSEYGFGNESYFDFDISSYTTNYKVSIGRTYVGFKVPWIFLIP